MQAAAASPREATTLNNYKPRRKNHCPLPSSRFQNPTKVGYQISAMPKASEALYYLVHPSELRAIIQW
jgi:hypothetical protein